MIAGRSIPINIPNILTLLRILLTPLFAIYLIKHLFAGALLVFAVAAVTDGLDGLAARIFGQHSRLGTYLDPAADKLLLVTAFVTLGIQELIPSWLAVIVITRDVVILSGVVLFTIIGREFEPTPSMLGKITTVAQIVSVITVLTGFQIRQLALAQVQTPVFWVAAGITVLSGLHYMYRGLSLLQEEL
jgi:cardiolipin synthase